MFLLCGSGGPEACKGFGWSSHKAGNCSRNICCHDKPSKAVFLADSSGSVLKNSHSLAGTQRMLVVSMPCWQRSVSWLPARYWMLRLHKEKHLVFQWELFTECCREYCVSKYDCNNCASSHGKFITKFHQIFVILQGTFPPELTWHIDLLNDI